MTHIKDVLTVAFSQSHIRDQEKMYVANSKGHFNIVKVTESKMSKVGRILLNISTLGIAWVVYDLYTANRKVKKIEQDHLNLSSVIYKKPVKETVISHGLSGGRLGDNLMSLLGAYYVAYKNNLPFYYKPFKGSEQFVFSDKLQPVAPNFSFKTKASCKTWEEVNSISELDKNASTLVTIDPFADARCNWDDPGFKKAAQELIQSKEMLNPISLPSDKIPIALHIRTGGGFSADNARVKAEMPSKFPPIEFYVEGLREMIKGYGPNEKFYVHIFTDDPNPSKLAADIKEKFPDIDLEFGYRTEDNRHDANVLDDFFNMAQFKGLVRPWSGLSQAAEVIGNHEMIYEPSGWLKPGFVERTYSNTPVVVPGHLKDKRPH